jgi:hypothetical protein
MQVKGTSPGDTQQLHLVSKSRKQVCTVPLLANPWSLRTMKSEGEGGERSQTREERRGTDRGIVDA